MTSSQDKQALAALTGARVVVIGLAVFMWVAVLILALTGRAWKEAALWAAFGTVCLSGFDLTFSRRPAGKADE